MTKKTLYDIEQGALDAIAVIAETPVLVDEYACATSEEDNFNKSSQAYKKAVSEFIAVISEEGPSEKAAENVRRAMHNLNAVRHRAVLDLSFLASKRICKMRPEELMETFDLNDVIAEISRDGTKIVEVGGKFDSLEALGRGKPMTAIRPVAGGPIETLSRSIPAMLTDVGGEEEFGKEVKSSFESGREALNELGGFDSDGHLVKDVKALSKEHAAALSMLYGWLDAFSKMLGLKDCEFAKRRARQQMVAIEVAAATLHSAQYFPLIPDSQIDSLNQACQEGVSFAEKALADDKVAGCGEADLDQVEKLKSKGKSVFAAPQTVQ